MLNFRSPEALTAAIDAWIASQPDPRPSRPEAIRRLLAEAFGKPPVETERPTIGDEAALPQIPKSDEPYDGSPM